MEKPLAEFYRDRKRKDGLTPWCQSCCRASGAAYRKTSAVKIREKNLRWQQRNRERCAAYSRRWRNRNPEKVREANQRAIQRDPVAWRERSAKYDRENPEKRRERLQRYRARKLDAFVADVVADEIIARDGNLCGICGLPVEEPPHLDHIIPLAAGGTHEPDNVQVAHPHCNHRKWANPDYCPD